MSKVSFSFTEKSGLLSSMGRQLLETILESTGNGISYLRAIRNKQSEIVAFDYVISNQAFRDMAGNISLPEFHHHLKVPAAVGLQNQLISIVESGKEFNEDVTYEINGKEYFFRLNAVKLEDGVLLTLHDITTEKTYEWEVIHANKKLASVLENNNNGVLALRAIRDKENKITDFELLFTNTVLKKALGDNELEGRKFKEIFSNLATDDLFTNLCNVIHNDSVWSGELNYTDKDIEKWMHISATRLDDGCLLSCHDITRRKRTEKELSEAHKLLLGVFNASPLGITYYKAIRTNKGEITDFIISMENKVAEEVWQHSRVGQNLSATLPEVNEDHLFDHFTRVINNGESLDLVEEYNGQWYRITAVRLDDGVLATRINFTSYKKAEEALQDEMHFIAQVADSVPLLITVLNIPEMKFEFLNNFDLGVGLSPDEILKLTEEERNRLTHPDDQEKRKKFYATLSTNENNGTISSQYRIKTKNGKWKWIMASGKSFKRDANGNVNYCLIIYQDIHELKTVEEELKENTHFINNITRFSPDIISVYNITDGKQLYSNRKFSDIFFYEGMNNEAFYSGDLLHLLHPDDKEAWNSFLERVIRINESDIVHGVFRFLGAAKTWIWLDTRGVVFHTNEDGTASQFMMISENVTEKMQAETELNESRHFIEQLAKATPHTIYVLDLQNKVILYMNEQGREMFGNDATTELDNEFKIKGLTVHNDDIERWHKHLKECEQMEEREIKEIELRIKIRSNEWHWFCIRDTPFKIDEKSVVHHLVGIGWDINKQKLFENELILANRELEAVNDELKTFNFIAVHDFKETLRKVYTSLEFIASNDAARLSNEGRANIRRSQSAIQKLKLITDDIDSYSKINNWVPQFEKVDPNKIISRLVEELKGRIEKAEAKMNIGEFPLMNVDAFLFETLLYSLIDNSIKFRKPGVSPIISIHYSQVDEMNSDPSAIKNTGYGIISISDDGIGFDESEEEKIFDLFYRLHDKSSYRGSGMGLAIARKIMTIHKGFIRAAGKPGEGAVFKCYFPLEII